MLVPEIIIYNALNNFINLVEDDWNTNSDKTKTILYSLFQTDDNDNQLQFETYNWLEQAQSLFLRTDENVRKLKINIGYDLERLNTPTVHILMPSDSKGAIDSIGKDEQRTYDDITQLLTIKKTQSFRSVYHLMITSENNSEVLLVYYFFRSIFLLFHENFDLQGFANMQFTGQDINMDQDITPTHIFHRNLSLQFDYDSSASIRLPKGAMQRIKAGFCNNIQKDWNQYNNQPNPNIPNYYDGALGLDNLANYSQGY